MLKAAAELCSHEPAVLQLQQPCHIFGDIHGNFSDLKYFESLLWPLGVAYVAPFLHCIIVTLWPGTPPAHFSGWVTTWTGVGDLAA